jgi:hypothetical protein
MERQKRERRSKKVRSMGRWPDQDRLEKKRSVWTTPRLSAGALQIAPALLYYWALKLTLSALLGSLLETIALVRGNPREQVSEGF